MFDTRMERTSLWLLTLLLIACGQQQGVGNASPKSDGLLNAYVAQQTNHAGDGVTPHRRAELGRELAQLQSAASQGETVPGAQARAEIARLESLAHSAAEAAGVYAVPTDAELQQAYQAYRQSLPASEYHAAHILVANEILANAVIAELDQGKSFAEVARQRSADDSKSKGGDLGWIHPGHLPPEFFAVLARLEPGDYSRKPIHTPYGWHVLRLIETRAASPPSLEQVRAQLVASLRQLRYQQFLDSIKPRPN